MLEQLRASEGLHVHAVSADEVFGPEGVVRALAEQWRRAKTDTAEGERPVLFVDGLDERVRSEPALLSRLNEQRNELVRGVETAVVMVGSEATIQTLRRRAPDTWSIRAGDFALGPGRESLQRAAHLAASAWWWTPEVISWEDAIESVEHLLAAGELGVASDRAGAMRLSAERGGQNRTALGLCERMLEAFAEPDRRRATWLFYLGDHERKLKNSDAAMSRYREGLAIFEQLVRDEPGDAGLHHDVFISLCKIADIRDTRGELEAARDAYDGALTILAELVEREPEQADLQRDFSHCLIRLGEINDKLGELDASRRCYEDALALTLAVREPGREALHHDLAKIYECLGDLDIRQTELTADAAARARRYFEDTLAIRRQLLEREPTRVDHQRNLMISFSKLGQLEMKLGQREAARPYFERVLDIARVLVEQEPDNEALGDLARGCERMADVDDEQPLFWLDRAIAIHRERVALDPANASTLQSLAIVLYKKGQRAGQGGDEESGIAAWSEAHQIFSSLRAHGALAAHYHATADKLAELFTPDHGPS